MIFCCLALNPLLVSEKSSTLSTEISHYSNLLQQQYYQASSLCKGILLGLVVKLWRYMFYDGFSLIIPTNRRNLFKVHASKLPIRADKKQFVTSRLWYFKKLKSFLRHHVCSGKGFHSFPRVRSVKADVWLLREGNLDHHSIFLVCRWPRNTFLKVAPTEAPVETSSMKLSNSSLGTTNS